MKQLIEYFDRAYIINLPERTDRRRSITQEFDAIGIKIPDKKVQFFSAIRPKEAGDFYAIGAKGSFYSHRSVLELAAAARLNNVLVFEDDVAFRKIPAAQIERILSALRAATWDVVYFGYLEPESVELKGPLAEWPDDTLGGHFYAVNGRFANTMIRYMNECEGRPRNHPDGGPMSRDGAFNHIRYVIPNIHVLLAVPNLAFQRSSRTDIAPVRFYDRLPLLRPIVELARAAKTKIRFSLDKIDPGGN